MSSAVPIDPFVSADWLLEHRDEVVVADVRWYLDGRSGRDAYDTGHVPGAVFVDLDVVLAGHGDESAGRHPLPPAAVFAAELGALGIGDDSTVVAYDDAGGVIAARLVWMLRAVGVAAAVLDGGIGAWQGPLQSVAPSPQSAVFSPKPWPAAAIADIEEASGGAALVLDARDGVRYRGEFEPVDPRAGHIPGARNAPCRENLGSDGRLRPRDELRRIFADAGVTAGSDVISYCGSGVTACHNLLTLEWAGYGKGRLFPGSWSEYSRATDRPVAVGTE